jgi:hypothetical protein
MQIDMAFLRSRGQFVKLDQVIGLLLDQWTTATVASWSFRRLRGAD